MMSNRTMVPRAARQRRDGFSLVEVIVAILLLSGVLLVLGGFSFKFARATGQAHLVITANEIAATRMDQVKQAKTYDAVDLLGVDTTVTKDFTNFQVHTVVLHQGSATVTQDLRYVTVTVSHPSMTRAVTKTTAIAAF